MIKTFYQIAEAIHIDQSALPDAYKHLKRVVQAVSKGSRYKSTSLRWEVRLDDPALDRLDENMRSRETMTLLLPLRMVQLPMLLSPPRPSRSGFARMAIDSALDLSTSIAVSFVSTMSPTNRVEL